jgi:hypothetical protein
VRLLLMNFFVVFLWYLPSVETCLSDFTRHALWTCSHFLGWISIQVNVEPLWTHFTRFFQKNSFVTCMSPLLPHSLHNLSSYSILTVHLQSAYNLYWCVCVYRHNFMKEIMLEKQIVNQTSQKLTHLLWSLNVNYHLPKSKLPNNCPELHKWRLHPYTSSFNIYFKWSIFIYVPKCSLVFMFSFALLFPSSQVQVFSTTFFSQTP